MKQSNLRLIEDISVYKQLLESERRSSTFTNHRLNTLDVVNAKNDDLNDEIKNYKQILKQLESENISLKNENEKYKLALSNYDQAKQKREEIYKNNLSKSDQTIKSLEQERDSLQLIISTQFQMLYASQHENENENENDIKKEHETMNSNLPNQTLEILRIASIISNKGPNKGPNKTPPGANRMSICNTSINTGFIPRFEQYSTDYPDLYGIDIDSATPTPKNVASPPNLTAANTENDHDIEFENGMIDCGYNTYNGNFEPGSNHLPDDSNNYNYNYKSQFIQNVITQSIKMRRDSLIGYDTDKDKLNIQIDQHLQTIDKLRKERKTLRQENNEMRKKLNAGFKCSAPWQWFS